MFLNQPSSTSKWTLSKVFFSKISEKRSKWLLLWQKRVGKLLQKQPPEVFYKERCSYKFRKINRKHLCQSLFLNKVAGLRPATILKKKLWHRCFPVNLAKFLGTPFLQNTSGRLLLLLQIKADFLKSLLVLHWFEATGIYLECL